jgi:hypothetical protein
MHEGKAIWKLATGVRFRRLFDEAMLIREGVDEALMLNDTGVSFVELCDGERTADEIVGVMAGNFEVSLEELEADMAVFVAELAAEGIIERV